MFYEAFPKELNNDLKVVLNTIPKETYNHVTIGCSENMIEYRIHYSCIKFPYRIYFIDIDSKKLNDLTNIQKEILFCIYTRSSNGYVREKYLKELLQIHFDEWAIPFIVKLCDEYVIEILELIYNQLKERDNSDIQNFCLENKITIYKSYSKMISYWNEFYRHKENHFHRYVGRKLFRECLGYNREFEHSLKHDMNGGEKLL